MDLPANPSISITTCDGVRFKQLMGGALAWLEQNYKHVDQLNVFPVPDGDTGTNMLMTVTNAYKEIAANESADIGAIAVRFAHGALRGSRGNSGTILSEMLRGFAHELSGSRTADAALVAKSFREAARLAYGVVQHPTEGTILTVAREITEEVEDAARESNDLLHLLQRAVARGKDALARTPEMLPILKKAGVVDSGAAGLVYLFEGMLKAAQGESLVLSQADTLLSPANLHDTLRTADPQGYGYDVQYVLHGANLDIEAIRAKIGAMGDSMVVVGDAALIKVHIHVHDPGVPLSYGVSLGTLDDIVVENMQAQSETYIAGRDAESATSNLMSDPDVIVNAGEIAVIAIAPGDGLRRVFRGLGVATVIDGGQTMNPSGGELIDAINALDTDKIVLLPNNKNIVLTAEQAAKAVPHKQVKVVQSRTAPQGIAAMLSFNAEGDLDTVVEAMSTARLSVSTGEVTTAVRSIQLDGVDAREGQLIGLVDGTLAVSGDNMFGTVKNLLWRMNITDRELVTLYYGADVSTADAEILTDSLREAYPSQEFEVFQGGQPYYFYILSAE